MNLRAVAVAMMLVGRAWATEPACSKEDMAEIQDVMPSLAADMRGALVSRAIVDACEKKIPTGVQSGIKAVNMADPVDRAVMAAHLVLELPSFSKLGCAKFPAPFDAATAAAPADKARVLYTGCDYGKLGLMSQAELATALNRAPGHAILAAPLYKWLIDNGVAVDAARKIIRAMAGL